MTTPISVLTNVAYVAAGLYVLRGQVLYTQTNLVKPPGYKSYVRTLSSWLVGLSLIALGIASGLYHGFYSPWAQLADERGMYLVFGVLAGVVWRYRLMSGVFRLSPDMAWRLRSWPFVWLGLALGLFLAVFAAEPWVDSMIVVPALAVLCILGVGVGQSWARALKFLVAFAAIAAIRELPEANFWARDPLFGYDLIHGAWHLVTALWMVYLYKSTEG